MGQRKLLIYWKDLGKVSSKHDDFNNMHGWFQKLLRSRVSLSVQSEKEANTSSLNSQSATSSDSSLPLSSSPGRTPSKPLQSQSALSSQLRWSRKYDVFVCHSTVDSDSDEAALLVSFLEASPRNLRCFLRHRDDCPGGAISTELCQAVQSSHLWALFITPSFLQDDWCQYMMHQALAEGPMSRRIIPLVQNLSRAQYPQELKFRHPIDLTRNPDRGYTLLYKTVVIYLEDTVKNEKTFECSVDSSSTGLSVEDNSKQDALISKTEHTTSVPLEVLRKRDGNFSEDCCDQHQHQQ